MYENTRKVKIENNLSGYVDENKQVIRYLQQIEYLIEKKVVIERNGSCRAICAKKTWNLPFFGATKRDPTRIWQQMGP